VVCAQLGSIAVGKRADFVVVDRDPWLVPAAALRTTVVWATYLDGAPVYCDADAYCPAAPALTPATRAWIAEREAMRRRWLRATAGRGATEVRPDRTVRCGRPTARAHDRHHNL
jgi:hypothetical protein